jgi:hypothetical protein
MPFNHFLKAGLLAFVLVIAFVTSYEFFWRSKGFQATFNDDEALWAKKRADVYKPAGKATVFIGSSRIKFDLDIDTWRQLTGEDAIQLAMVGTNPRPILTDLANDSSFNGKLIIDVTENLFFSHSNYQVSAKKGISYFHDLTPAQRTSSLLNAGLEKNLVFLEEKRFGLNALLTDLNIPNRKGVFSLPPMPKDFGLTTADRQDYMSPRFLRDTCLQKWQTDVWKYIGILSERGGVGGDTLENILEEVKISLDKIRARGGKIMFVRTPESGPLKKAASISHPRNQYWNRLLLYAHCEGIHYMDYRETDHFICPEWSHLSSTDAITYTKHLAWVLQEEKGWQFNKKITIPDPAKN